MNCPRTRFYVQGCLAATWLASFSPVAGQQAAPVQNALNWNIPSTFRPQAAGPDHAQVMESVMRQMSQTKPAPDADTAQRYGVNSPENLLAQLRQIYAQFDRGETEVASARLDELRQKANEILNDGRPPEQQSEILKALRSILMNAGEELALRRGDHGTVIKSATEHLKLLASFDEPRARGREVRTAMFLIDALKNSQRSSECIPWIRHVVTLLKTKEVAPSDTLAEDLSQIATQARSLDQIDDAAYLADKAVNLIESSVTIERKSQVIGLTQIAMVHLEQNKLLEAEAVLLKARKLADEEKADVAVMGPLLNNLGRTQQRIYAFQGGKDRLEQAEKYFQEAYELLKKEGGNTPMATSIRLSNLAGVEALKGNAAEALKLRKEAWDIVEKELGPNSEATLTALSNYTQTVEIMGRLPEALKLCQELAQRAQTAPGGLHPRVAEVQHMLGRAHMRLGHLNEAEKCYERAAGIRERALGTEHGETAKSYYNLGLIREAKQDYAGATAYFEHVLKIDRKAHGDDSEDVAEDTAALARTLMKEERYDEALARVNEHLDVLEKKLGEDHPVMAMALLALATVQEGRERFAEAEKIYQKAIAIRIKALGEEHALVAEAHGRYALFLLTRNKLTMAAGELRIAAASFARHRQREGTHGDNLNSCLEIYVQILRKMQYDQTTIQKHIRLLESGVNPVEEKGRTSV